MSVLEVLKLVGQGGFPVLFALLLMGLGWMGVKLGPQVLTAWSNMISAINELKTALVSSIGEQNVRIAALTTKLDSVERTLEAMRQQDVNTALAAAAATTGAHGTVSSEEAERLVKPAGQYTFTEQREREKKR
jgi:hypothetical protein